MTTATVSPPATQAGEPRWYRPLLIWRVLTTLLVLAALGGTLLRRGIVLAGPVRWTLVIALIGAVLGSLIAIRGTIAPRHVGRLSGFMLDLMR